MVDSALNSGQQVTKLCCSIMIAMMQLQTKESQAYGLVNLRKFFIYVLSGCDFRMALTFIQLNDFNLFCGSIDIDHSI